MKIHYKIFIGVLIIFTIFLIIANFNFGSDNKIIWGATFSKLQAEELGINWVIAYGAMIDELNLKTVRLPVYWPDVEKSPGVFDFSAYDWMIEKALKNDVEIVPVLGRRVPRWPECHTPEMYKNLTADEIKIKIFALLKAEVEHFKKYSNIKKWQLDNEPFADFFGQCPLGEESLVREEVALVRSLDKRPVMITESGELSLWFKGAKIGDFLGVSMYRQTWNKRWGWFNYPLPPAFYYFKAKIVKLFTPVKKIINTELQVEPWAIDNNLTKMDLFDQFYSMDLAQVKSNVKFARSAGLDEIYLWGVEWWWWLGEKKGDWSFWEYGKTISSDNF